MQPMMSGNPARLASPNVFIAHEWRRVLIHTNIDLTILVSRGFLFIVMDFDTLQSLLVCNALWSGPFVCFPMASLPVPLAYLQWYDMVLVALAFTVVCQAMFCHAISYDLHCYPRALHFNTLHWSAFSSVAFTLQCYPIS